MGEQGVDPTPTPPHPLVIASEALDAAVADSGGLLEVLQRDQKHRRAEMRRINVVVGVLVIAVVVLIFALFKISENSNQIESAKRARHVFCLETNSNNSEARVVLVKAFPAASNPALVRQIAADLFPIRDCTKDPPLTIDTVSVGVLPAPPSSDG